MYEGSICHRIKVKEKNGKEAKEKLRKRDAMHLFMPPDRMIGGILFLSCLLSTLTFAITFEPLEVETSYLACILH